MNEIREINVNEIKEAVASMCIEVNHVLSKDMCSALNTAYEKETSQLGRQILNQLKENLVIA